MYIFTHTCTYAHTFTYVHTHKYACTYVMCDIRTCTCTWHMCTRAHAFARMYAYIVHQHLSQDAFSFREPSALMHTRLVSNSAPMWSSRCCFTACRF